MYNMGVGISGCLKSGLLEESVSDFPYKVSRLLHQAAYFLFILDLTYRYAATSAVAIVQIFAKAESISTLSPLS